MTNEPDIDVAYSGKYITLTFPYHPRLLTIMKLGAPAASWNRKKRHWQMPANDISIEWLDDFEKLWTGIKLKKKRSYSNFIKQRTGTTDKVKRVRSSIKTKLASVDNYKFKLKPYAHQLEAIRFLVRRYKSGERFAALFYDMGLGKTKIVIDAASILKWKKILIILPKTLSYSWRVEVKKNLGSNKVAIFDGTKGTSSSRAWNLTDFMKRLDSYTKFVLINYDAIRSDSLFDTLCSYRWDAMCLDESTYIKSPSAQRTKQAVKLAQYADFRLLMTGTPVTNSYLDLYAPLRFLSPSILGIPTFTAYKATYGIYIERERRDTGKKFKMLVNWKNIDDLLEKIRLHSLIATKDEVFNLPKKMPAIIRAVSLDDYPEIRKAYNNMRKQLIHIFEDGTEVTAKNVLSKCLRLQQITSGFLTEEYFIPGPDDKQIRKTRIIPISEPPKISALVDIVNELGDSEKVIVAARFRYDVEQITKAMHQAGKIQVITGSVTGTKRDKAIEQFEDGDARFLIGTPQTFGYGLTLVSTRYLVWYSPSFSFEHRKQTSDRINRPGQKRRPFFIDLVCENTIDDLIILPSLTMKEGLYKYVMHVGSKLTELLPEL